MSLSPNSVGGRHDVVIIGSGFGGLFAVKALKDVAVDVTLISRTTHHLFQPLLYQVATGILSEGEIAPSTRDILKKQKNVTVLLGDVTTIDVQAQTVTSLAVGTTTVTHYDSLIVAAGAQTSYFGQDQWAVHAPGLKSIDDALELRSRIFGAFEMAELEPDEAIRQEWLTFVVVGAGPTGVEMAGQISETAKRTLKNNFRSIDPSKAKIILLDAAGSVLGTFGHKLSAKAAHELEKIGVQVWLNAKVVDVEERGIEILDDQGHHERIPTRTTVWAAGVRASGLGKKLADQVGLEVDRSGRIPVNPDLTLPGHPEIFVIGDVASLKDYPGVSQVAMQGGKYAVTAIERRLKGQAAQAPFQYFDKGSMATISRFNAVASIGNRLRFEGFIAWVLWLGVHLFYLVGFKNRVTTLLHWTVTFIGNGRSERTGTYQQSIARRALSNQNVRYLGVPSPPDPNQSGPDGDSN
jgi:NADH dehydrogenase